MITLTETVPHRAFLTAMLARHYDLAGTPTVLITTDAAVPVADTIARVILITHSSDNSDSLLAPYLPARPTLVIGPAAIAGAAHARLATAHPAELLAVIDGYLRHPERYPVGTTREPARV